MVIEFLILLEKVTFELLSNDRDLEIDTKIILKLIFHVNYDLNLNT